MKLSGSKEARIIQFTFYLMVRISIFLSILGVIFIFCNFGTAFIYILFLQIVQAIFHKKTYDFYSIPARVIIDYYYKKLGIRDEMGFNIPVWNATDLLFDYLFSFLRGNNR